MPRARLKRKGLSPLVATVVLISATIVGGMLVYQYFQNSINKAQNMAEGLTITADLIQLDNGQSLVYVTVSNGYDTEIQVTGAKAVYPNGTISTITPTQDTTLPAPIPSGEKNTFLFTAPTAPEAVIVQYTVNGQQYQTEPITIG
ncbi:MAG: hypothetical protein GSR77_06225 [Desulfurococcales archaeon]|nr:hypothetical protein [Desulfurococcales archaeon]